MYGVSNYNNFSFISTFYTYVYFAYLNYSYLQINGCGNHSCTADDYISMINNASQLNEYYNILSTTGTYYSNLITQTYVNPTPTPAPSQIPTPTPTPKNAAALIGIKSIFIFSIAFTVIILSN